MEKLKEELIAEIAKLEGEAKQLLANANFINGAISAFRNALEKTEAGEEKPKKKR